MTREEILAVIKANIVSVVEHVNDQDIQEDVLLSDLYADSIEIVEVISRSMKQLRLKIPRTSLADAYYYNDGRYGEWRSRARRSRCRLRAWDRVAAAFRAWVMASQSSRSSRLQIRCGRSRRRIRLTCGMVRPG